MRRWLAALLAVAALAGCGHSEPEPEARLFGFNSALSLWAVAPAKEVRLERTAGARMQRFPAIWRALQPREGDPPLGPGESRDRLDALYRELVRNRMTPVVIVANAPPWAAGGTGPDWLPPDRRHVDDWARFVGAAARRYPRAVIEPWNEPNFAVFWRAKRDPALMARLQCAAYRAVSRKRTVLSPGFAVRRGFADYAGAFYRHGGGRCFDGFSAHLYGDVEGRLGVARAIRSRYRDRTPIWVTETGSASRNETEQAEIDAGLYDRLSEMPDVHAVLFHTLRDANDRPLLGHPEKRDYHYGFLRVDFTPKPVYCEFAKRARARPSGC